MNGFIKPNEVEQIIEDYQPPHIHGPYIVTEWRYDYNADFSTSEYQKLMHERIPFNRLKAEAYRCSVCLEPWEGDKTV